MNLEQVARRAKVSTATVSRVLNNASVVKTSTRARVEKAIEELKYHPNLHARNLAGGKSRSLGVIASNMENPFFFDIYKTIESDAHARGYEVVVANTDYKSEQLVTSIRLMIGRRVAGLAAIVSEMEPALIKKLTESRIPVVFYDVGQPRQNIQDAVAAHQLAFEVHTVHQETDALYGVFYLLSTHIGALAEAKRDRPTGMHFPEPGYQWIVGIQNSHTVGR